MLKRKLDLLVFGIMEKIHGAQSSRAGYEVSIYTRTKSKVEDVIAGRCGVIQWQTAPRQRCGHYHCWISLRM